MAYLSATSVYGDRSGRWAYEGEPPTPGLNRGKARAEAELAWIETIWPVHIFRLAGISDGHPAPPQDVLDYAAGLLELPPPPRVQLDDPSISDMARSFYAETKRINADKARQELGWTPQHLSYRDGLESILREIS